MAEEYFSNPLFSFAATINGSQIELTESEGVYTGSFAMPGQASSLVINTGGSSGGNGGADLDKD